MTYVYVVISIVLLVGILLAMYFADHMKRSAPVPKTNPEPAPTPTPENPPALDAPKLVEKSASEKIIQNMEPVVMGGMRQYEDITPPAPYADAIKRHEHRHRIHEYHSHKWQPTVYDVESLDEPSNMDKSQKAADLSSLTEEDVARLLALKNLFDNKE